MVENVARTGSRASRTITATRVTSGIDRRPIQAQVKGSTSAPHNVERTRSGTKTVSPGKSHWIGAMSSGKPGG